MLFRDFVQFNRKQWKYFWTINSPYRNKTWIEREGNRVAWSFLSWMRIKQGSRVLGLVNSRNYSTGNTFLHLFLPRSKTRGSNFKAKVFDVFRFRNFFAKIRTRKNYAGQKYKLGQQRAKRPRSLRKREKWLIKIVSLKTWRLPRQIYQGWNTEEESHFQTSLLLSCAIYLCQNSIGSKAVKRCP